MPESGPGGGWGSPWQGGFSMVGGSGLGGFSMAGGVLHGRGVSMVGGFSMPGGSPCWGVHPCQTPPCEQNDRQV